MYIYITYCPLSSLSGGTDDRFMSELQITHNPSDVDKRFDVLLLHYYYDLLITSTHYHIELLRFDVVVWA